MTLQKIPTGIKFPLYEGVKLINEAIEAADKAQQDSASAKTTSENALSTSQSAETKADSVQEQFNQVVIEGDSSVEAAQARVDAEGKTFTTLKDRLDTSDEVLAQTETVISEGGLDRLKTTSYFETTLPSYIALINQTYTGDSGTRYYICPREEIVTGAGGVIKIFADPYHLGTSDYRDMGWYFHADQNGDTGANSKGVWWLNSKTNGKHLNQFPDIAFGFQDGKHVPARFVCTPDGKTGLVIGKDTDKFIRLYPTFGMEVQKHIVMRKDQAIYFEGGDGNATTKLIYNSSAAQFEMIVGGKVVATYSLNKQTSKNAIVQNYQSITNNSATPSVADGNVYVLANTTTTAITDFLNGAAGQVITLVINDNVTTIKNGSGIKLKGGLDFRPTNLLSNITLTRLGTQWVESHGGRVEL